MILLNNPIVAAGRRWPGFEQYVALVNIFGIRKRWPRSIGNCCGFAGGQAIGDDIIRKIRYYLRMKKLQPGEKIVKVDKELGIAWILLPPDPALGGFQGISPRIMDEEKFISAKKKAEKK